VEEGKIAKKVRDIILIVLGFGKAKYYHLLYSKGIARRLPVAERVYCCLYRYGLSKDFFGEPMTAALIRKILKEGMTFLDVGANCGTYTFLASKLVGEKGRVFAFEPHPDCFTIFQGITKGCGNVTAVQKAVSNKRGMTKLYFAPYNSANQEYLMLKMEQYQRMLRLLL
jgi:hypothetical protein